jgi:hypothetical protein
MTDIIITVNLKIAGTTDALTYRRFHFWATTQVYPCNSLVRRETSRRCREGSRSLTFPGVHQ